MKNLNSSLRKYWLLLKEKGCRYFLFRSIYEIERKTGLLVNKFPIRTQKNNLFSLSDFEKEKSQSF